MKLVADAGGWTLGPAVAEAPAVAVLEVSGAVLAWTVDDPAGVRLTITDAAAADWLWRAVGPSGHAAIVAGDAGDAGDEVAELDLRPDVLDTLRRLAMGHWLRRWWPESRLSGMPRLDPALLDGELAVLTHEAQEFFTEDTVDSDVVGLLAPHQAALLALERDGDPRVAEVVGACTELADDSGAWPAAKTVFSQNDSGHRRADYALAAGPGPGRTFGAIARGVGSVDWVAVPPATFDAAEDTIDWSVESADASVVAMVRVATTGEASPRGIDVRLSSGTVRGAGVLDANGMTALTLGNGAGGALTETQAWDHDWSTTTVTVGADVVGEGRVLRQRIRDFAGARLVNPGPDAFLAEILAAESDY